MAQSRVAYEVAPVAENLSLRVECLDSWGTNLIVGTTEGTLLLFEVTSIDADGRCEFHVKEAKEGFSKKAIVQLSVLEDLGVLVCLSDGMISAFDLPSFHLRTQLSKARGCTVFSVNRVKHVDLPVLCAAVKKRIYLYKWEVWEEAGFIDMQELAVSESAKALLLVGPKLFVGSKKEYTLFNVEGSAVASHSTVFPLSPSRGAVPHASALPHGEVLLSKDNMGVCVGYDGCPTRKTGFNWGDCPSAFGYHFPYVVGLLPRSVDIMSPQTLKFVQSILFPQGCRALCVKENVFVATQRAVYHLLQVPLLQQVEDLYQQKDFVEALALCEMIPQTEERDKYEKMKFIHVQYAFHLFGQKQYEEAMKNFKMGHADPLEVMSLFPDLLPVGTQTSRIRFTSDLPKIEGPELGKALTAVIPFLLEKRDPAFRPAEESNADDDLPARVDPQVFSVVDTFLLRAYLLTNEKLVGLFLSMPNRCSIENAESILLSKARYMELVALYKGRGLHRKALELLARVGESDAQQRSAETPIDALKLTIQYLKELGRHHEGLVMEFSRWPLREDPEAALEIFTYDSPSREALSHVTVLAHLGTHSPALCMNYLEHIISTRGETDPHFHNELISLYLEYVLALVKDPTVQVPASPKERLRAGQEPGLLGVVRTKLLGFLESSMFYNPEKMLSKFPFNDLLEERALLLSRIGQHEPALIIYAHRLRSPQLAEEYCRKHYNTDSATSRDVFLSLLHVYLRPPEGCPVMAEEAVQLMSKYFDRVDAKRALDLVPSHTSICRIAPFVESVLRMNIETRRNNQIVKSLLKAEELQVREQLMHARRTVIRVTQDRMCPVCNKRIGNSVFARYPNGTVVHYVCCKDARVCPITRQRFGPLP